MVGLSIRRIDKADRTVLMFSGSLDETSTLTWATFRDLKPQVSIHLRRLAKINSCGIREWINFASRIPAGISVTLEQCSVPFMAQAERIANFLGRTTVHSCMVALGCPECGTEVERLVTMDAQGRPRENLACTCPSCAHPMIADTVGNATGELPVVPLPSPAQGIAGGALATDAGLSLEGAIRAIFAHSVIPVALLSADDRMRFANDAWAQFFERDLVELDGEPIAEIATFEVAGSERHLIRESRHSGTAVRWREVHLRQVPASSVTIELTPFSAGMVLLRILDLTVEASLHHRYRQLWGSATDSHQLVRQLSEQLDEKSLELASRDQLLRFTREDLEAIRPQLEQAQRLAAFGESANLLISELGHCLEQISTGLGELLRELPPDARDPSAAVHSLATHTRTATLLADNLATLLKNPDSSPPARPLAPSLHADTN